MMRRALSLSALFTLAVLAGCLDDGPSQADDGANDVALAPNVGGSDKVVTSVFPGEYDFEGPYSRVLTPGTLKIKAAEEVRVPSDIDGEDILMGLHLPETTEKVPVLLFASPYFGFLGGDNDVTDRIEGDAFGNLIGNFVPHGYAVVGLAARGTGNSGGCNDLMGPQETADLDQAVTWLGTQDWSNGNVAMTGVSYDGSTPWAVASVGNPHLKTIIPISGVPDMYGLMYRNGSAESRGPFVLNLLYYGGNIAVGTMEPTRAPTRAACPDALVGTAMSGVAGFTGNDPSGFWQERNRKPGVEANYKGSVFSVQGLQDWNVDPSQVIPWVDQLESQGIRTKQLLGQWEHSWPDSIGEGGDGLDCPGGNPNAEVCNRADYNEILLRWLDQELKGKTVDTGAPVQVQDNLGRWRNEEHFPPHDATWTTYNLTAGGLLDATSAGPRASALLYPSVSGFPPSPPPNVDSGVGAAADFVLGPVTEDLLISGLPKVHVTVTPQGPGGYLGAYLYAVGPEGVVTPDPVYYATGEGDPGTPVIGWTTMNLAFADGGTERQEVMPGEAIRAMLEIQPMDAVVKEGQQLVLRLWVFTDADRLPTIPPGPVAIEMGDGVQSTFILPTIQRDESVYFEPPQ